MKSIRTMIMGIFFIFSIIISTMLIIVSYVGINVISDRDNDRIMELITMERKRDIESMMNDVSRSLDNIYYITRKELEENPEKIDDPSYRQEVLDRVSDLALVEASSAESAVAVYMRFSDEVMEDPAGFLYRRNIEGNFEKVTLTDISMYDKNDLNHVGWYYIPQRSKSPVWIGPYRNENLDYEIVSYIAPVYLEGKFMALVGMDMDVDVFRDRAEKIRLYETGTAVIFDAEDNIIYSRDASGGIDRDLFDNETMILLQAMKESLKKDRPVEYASSVKPMKLYAIKLENNMTLCLTAPIDEIYSLRTTVLGYAILCSVIVMLVSLILIYHVIKIALRPLKELTEASEQVTKGNLDIKLDYLGDDEFGQLSGTFNNMTAMMRSYFYHFHSLAYTDELTGLNNKAAFSITRDVIESEIKMGRAAFSIVSIDINGMSSINEKAGYQRGDEVIGRIVLSMRETFVGFPLYRIEGDRFCAIINDADAQILIDKLMRIVEKRSMEDKENFGIEYSVAAGEAAYENESDKNFEEVYERAVQVMLRNKNKMTRG
ncbi:MAG: diguanylate cyclase [Lachnospiraceae bacterium]|nr:diguanylate cyclase [Lachnospiraceae bacterium]